MALSEGVAIDAQDDESARQKTVREFEITDVGEFRVGHLSLVSSMRRG